VIVPARYDLVLARIEATFMRWGDADNVVPDIAAVERDRIVVDADIAVEGLGDDIEALGDVGRKLAIGRAAGTVDGVDRHGGKAELLGRFGDAGAAAALVFHLVAQVGDLLARALDGDFLLQ